MVTKFTRKELERIGRTEEEIDLVMEYQKKLPFPDNDFEMSARTLHDNLNVGREFSSWIIGRIKKYNFSEHSDYEIRYVSSDTKLGDADFSMYSKQQLSAMGVKKEYYITLTMAKELCTIENNDIGRLARRYFSLMEDIVLQTKEWLAIRDPEKVEYKKRSAEVDAWCFLIWHHHASRSEYAVEADMLNMIVTSKTSQQLKSEYGVASNDMIRDYLKKEHNEELLFLEQQNQVLLLMDMGFTERKNMLTKMHEVKFKNAINTAVA